MSDSLDSESSSDDDDSGLPLDVLSVMRQMELGLAGDNTTAASSAASVRRFSHRELAETRGSGNIIVAIRGKVYDLTAFASDHPGSKEVLDEHAGTDATVSFEGVGHSMAAREFMEVFFVGDLAEDGEVLSASNSSSETAAIAEQAESSLLLTETPSNATSSAMPPQPPKPPEPLRNGDLKKIIPVSKNPSCDDNVDDLSLPLWSVLVPSTSSATSKTTAATSVSAPPSSSSARFNRAPVPISLGSRRWRGQDGASMYYCSRRLGREVIPGSDGQCGPTNGPQCPDCNGITVSSQFNRAGFLMTQSSGVFYCGRRLGTAAIPGSDGRCGPNNGPQCTDCSAPSSSTSSTSATPARSRRLAVGDRVRLAPGIRDGPLTDGSGIGEIYEDDSSAQPFHVRTEDGQTHRYREREIISATDSTTAASLSSSSSFSTSNDNTAAFSVGDRIRLSPDFANHGDASGGPLQVGDVDTIQEFGGMSGRRYRVRGWWYDRAALAPEFASSTPLQTSSDDVQSANIRDLECLKILFSGSERNISDLISNVSSNRDLKFDESVVSIPSGSDLFKGDLEVSLPKLNKLFDAVGRHISLLSKSIIPKTDKLSAKDGSKDLNISSSSLGNPVGFPTLLKTNITLTSSLSIVKALRLEKPQLCRELLSSMTEVIYEFCSNANYFESLSSLETNSIFEYLRTFIVSDILSIYNTASSSSQSQEVVSDQMKIEIASVDLLFSLGLGLGSLVDIVHVASVLYNSEYLTVSTMYSDRILQQALASSSLMLSSSSKNELDFKGREDNGSKNIEKIVSLDPKQRIFALQYMMNADSRSYSKSSNNNKVSNYQILLVFSAIQICLGAEVESEKIFKNACPKTFSDLINFIGLHCENLFTAVSNGERDTTVLVSMLICSMQLLSQVLVQLLSKTDVWSAKIALEVIPSESKIKLKNLLSRILYSTFHVFGKDELSSCTSDLFSQCINTLYNWDEKIDLLSQLISKFKSGDIGIPEENLMKQILQHFGNVTNCTSILDIPTYTSVGENNNKSNSSRATSNESASSASCGGSNFNSADVANEEKGISKITSAASFSGSDDSRIKAGNFEKVLKLTDSLSQINRLYFELKAKALFSKQKEFSENSYLTSDFLGKSISLAIDNLAKLIIFDTLVWRKSGENSITTTGIMFENVGVLLDFVSNLISSQEFFLDSVDSLLSKYYITSTNKTEFIEGHVLEIDTYFGSSKFSTLIMPIISIVCHFLSEDAHLLDTISFESINRLSAALLKSQSRIRGLLHRNIQIKIPMPSIELLNAKIHSFMQCLMQILLSLGRFDVSLETKTNIGYMHTIIKPHMFLEVSEELHSNQDKLFLGLLDISNPDNILANNLVKVINPILGKKFFTKTVGLQEDSIKRAIYSSVAAIIKLNNFGVEALAIAEERRSKDNISGAFLAAYNECYKQVRNFVESCEGESREKVSDEIVARSILLLKDGSDSRRGRDLDAKTSIGSAVQNSTKTRWNLIRQQAVSTSLASRNEDASPRTHVRTKLLDIIRGNKIRNIFQQRRKIAEKSLHEGRMSLSERVIKFLLDKSPLLQLKKINEVRSLRALQRALLFDLTSSVLSSCLDGVPDLDLLRKYSALNYHKLWKFHVIPKEKSKRANASGDNVVDEAGEEEEKDNSDRVHYLSHIDGCSADSFQRLFNSFQNLLSVLVKCISCGINELKSSQKSRSSWKEFVLICLKSCAFDYNYRDYAVLNKVGLLDALMNATIINDFDINVASDCIIDRLAAEVFDNIDDNATEESTKFKRDLATVVSSRFERVSSSYLLQLPRLGLGQVSTADSAAAGGSPTTSISVLSHIIDINKSQGTSYSSSTNVSIGKNHTISFWIKPSHSSILSNKADLTPQVGSYVIRGKNWTFNSDDGGCGQLGVVKERKSDTVIVVHWPLTNFTKEYVYNYKSSPPIFQVSLADNNFGGSIFNKGLVGNSDDISSTRKVGVPYWSSYGANLLADGGLSVVIGTNFTTSEQTTAKEELSKTSVFAYRSMRSVLYDSWNHVAIVQDGNSSSLYLNGELDVKVDLPYFVTCKRCEIVEIEESEHNYASNMDMYKTIDFGPEFASNGIKITFDEKSATEKSHDYVRFYKDETRTSFWGLDKYTGRRGEEKFAGVKGTPPLMIEASKFVLYFHSDGSNEDWGYKIYMTGTSFDASQSGYSINSAPFHFGFIPQSHMTESKVEASNHYLFECMDGQLASLCSVDISLRSHEVMEQYNTGFRAINSASNEELNALLVQQSFALSSLKMLFKGVKSHNNTLDNSITRILCGHRVISSIFNLLESKTISVVIKISVLKVASIVFANCDYETVNSVANKTALLFEDSYMKFILRTIGCVNNIWSRNSSSAASESDNDNDLKCSFYSNVESNAALATEYICLLQYLILKNQTWKNAFLEILDWHFSQVSTRQQQISKNKGYLNDLYGVLSLLGGSFCSGSYVGARAVYSSSPAGIMENCSILGLAKISNSEAKKAAFVGDEIIILLDSSKQPIQVPAAQVEMASGYMDKCASELLLSILSPDDASPMIFQERINSMVRFYSEFISLSTGDSRIVPHKRIKDIKVYLDDHFNATTETKSLSSAHALIAIGRSTAAYRCSSCRLIGPSTDTGSECCSECKLCSECCKKATECAVAQAKKKKPSESNVKLEMAIFDNKFYYHAIRGHLKSFALKSLRSALKIDVISKERPFSSILINQLLDSSFSDYTKSQIGCCDPDEALERISLLSSSLSTLITSSESKDIEFNDEVSGPYPAANKSLVDTSLLLNSSDSNTLILAELKAPDTRNAEWLSSFLSSPKELIIEAPSKENSDRLVFESAHPYFKGPDSYTMVIIPGAKRLKIVCDGKTSTKIGDSMKFLACSSVAAPLPLVHGFIKFKEVALPPQKLQFESAHNYKDNSDDRFEISIPGARELTLIFDPRCKSEANCDYLRFYSDSSYSDSTIIGQNKYTGSSWPSLTIPGDKCFARFYSDGSNNDWGYKFDVIGNIPKSDIVLSAEGTNKEQVQSFSSSFPVSASSASSSGGRGGGGGGIPSDFDFGDLGDDADSELLMALQMSMQDAVARETAAACGGGGGGSASGTAAAAATAPVFLMPDPLPPQFEQISQKYRCIRLGSVSVKNGFDRNAATEMYSITSGAIVDSVGMCKHDGCVRIMLSDRNWCTLKDPEGSLVFEPIAVDDIAVAPICCRNGHPLALTSRDNGWFCDARSETGGCKRGESSGGNTRGVPRYQCERCNFDYCGPCHDAKVIANAGSVSSGAISGSSNGSASASFSSTNSINLGNLLNLGTESWNKWKQPSTGNSWIQADLKRPYRVFRYGICSANDSPELDPETFELYGREVKSGKWIVLDAVSNCSFSRRWEWKWFNIDVTTSVFDSVKLVIKSTCNKVQRAPGTLLTVGSRVVLSPLYANCEDASSGPLQPGNVGIVVATDFSSKPLKVKKENGESTWWYTREALMPEPIISKISPNESPSSQVQLGHFMLEGAACDVGASRDLKENNTNRNSNSNNKEDEEKEEENKKAASVKLNDVCLFGRAGAGNWPGVDENPPLVIDDCCSFISLFESTNNSESSAWGYKVFVEPEFGDDFYEVTIHAGPDSQSEIIHTVPSGVVVSATVYKQFSSWFNIKINKDGREIEGWVNMRSKSTSLENRDLNMLCLESSVNPAEKATLTFESAHNYKDNSDDRFEISIPGATEMVIKFDSKCRTENNCDYMRFHTDSSYSDSTIIGQNKYTGSSWPSLTIPGDKCFARFYSDGSNNDWGYKFDVIGSIPSLKDVKVLGARKLKLSLEPPSTTTLFTDLKSGLKLLKCKPKIIRTKEAIAVKENEVKPIDILPSPLAAVILPYLDDSNLPPDYKEEIARYEVIDFQAEKLPVRNGIDTSSAAIVYNLSRGEFIDCIGRCTLNLSGRHEPVQVERVRLIDGNWTTLLVNGLSSSPQQFNLRKVSDDIDSSVLETALARPHHECMLRSAAGDRDGATCDCCRNEGVMAFFCPGCDWDICNSCFGIDNIEFQNKAYLCTSDASIYSSPKMSGDAASSAAVTTTVKSGNIIRTNCRGSLVSDPQVAMLRLVDNTWVNASSFIVTDLPPGTKKSGAAVPVIINAREAFKFTENAFIGSDSLQLSFMKSKPTDHFKLFIEPIDLNLKCDDGSDFHRSRITFQEERTMTTESIANFVLHDDPEKLFADAEVLKAALELESESEKVFSANTASVSSVVFSGGMTVSSATFATTRKETASKITPKTASLLSRPSQEVRSTIIQLVYLNSLISAHGLTADCIALLAANNNYQAPHHGNDDSILHHVKEDNVASLIALLVQKEKIASNTIRKAMYTKALASMKSAFKGISKPNVMRLFDSSMIIVETLISCANYGSVLTEAKLSDNNWDINLNKSTSAFLLAPNPAINSERLVVDTSAVRDLNLFSNKEKVGIVRGNSCHIRYKPSISSSSSSSGAGGKEEKMIPVGSSRDPLFVTMSTCLPCDKIDVAKKRLQYIQSIFNDPEKVLIFVNFSFFVLETAVATFSVYSPDNRNIMESLCSRKVIDTLLKIIVPFNNNTKKWLEILEKFSSRAIDILTQIVSILVSNGELRTAIAENHAKLICLTMDRVIADKLEKEPSKNVLFQHKISLFIRAVNLLNSCKFDPVRKDFNSVSCKRLDTISNSFLVKNNCDKIAVEIEFSEPMYVDSSSGDYTPALMLAPKYIVRVIGDGSMFVNGSFVYRLPVGVKNGDALTIFCRNWDNNDFAFELLINNAGRTPNSKSPYQKIFGSSLSGALVTFEGAFPYTVANIRLITNTSGHLASSSDTAVVTGSNYVFGASCGRLYDELPYHAIKLFSPLSKLSDKKGLYELYHFSKAIHKRKQIPYKVIKEQILPKFSKESMKTFLCSENLKFLSSPSECEDKKKLLILKDSSKSVEVTGKEEKEDKEEKEEKEKEEYTISDFERMVGEPTRISYPGAQYITIIIDEIDLAPDEALQILDTNGGVVYEWFGLKRSPLPKEAPSSSISSAAIRSSPSKVVVTTPDHFWHSSWCNTSLEFTEGNLCAKRPGGSSSYPAAFSEISGLKDVFKVRLEEGTDMTNSISFGISTLKADGTPSLSKSGSDGVGGSSNTYGLIENRQSSDPLRVYSDRSNKASFRKLRVGDVMSAAIDLEAFTLKVALNHDEFTHTIPLPNSINGQKYCFAMTFANDHKVRILNGESDETIEVESAPVIPISFGLDEIAKSLEFNIPFPNIEAISKASNLVTRNALQFYSKYRDEDGGEGSVGEVINRDRKEGDLVLVRWKSNGSVYTYQAEELEFLNYNVAITNPPFPGDISSSSKGRLIAFKGDELSVQVSRRRNESAGSNHHHLCCIHFRPHYSSSYFLDSDNIEEEEISSSSSASASAAAGGGGGRGGSRYNSSSEFLERSPSTVLAEYRRVNINPTLAGDLELMQYLDQVIKARNLNDSNSIFQLDWEKIAPSKVVIAQWEAKYTYTSLRAYTSQNEAHPGCLGRRLRLFLDFNKTLHQLLDSVGLESLMSKSKNIVFSNIVYSLREFIVDTIKKPIIEKSLAESAAASTSRFDLKFNRFKATKFALSGKVDHDAKFTNFSQAFAVMHFKDPKSLRSKDPLYKANFVGENSIDAGGPYRMTWTDFARELESPVLPLLIRTRNGGGKDGKGSTSGLNRDKFIINPGSTSITHMEMFSFLGKLMGIAFRSKLYLALNLSPIIWKLLILDTISIEDLKDIDTATIGELVTMKNLWYIDKDGSRISITEEDFPDRYKDCTFRTTTSDARDVELCPNGSSKDITISNREEYYHLAIQYHLHEFDRQIEAMRHGLGSVIPLSALSVLSWRDLELMVCGENEINIEMLKLETEYVGCSAEDAHIKLFWQAVESFDNEQRKMLVTFIWGRSRLPLTRPFEQKFKIHPLNKPDPDRRLPETHTCFFALDLPKYSTLEITKDKLLYGMANCTAIDGDGGNATAGLSSDDF